MPETRSGTPKLATALDLLAPDYRGVVFGIAVIAVASGVLAYVENSTLSALARALSTPAEAPLPSVASVSGVGIHATVFFLFAFVCARLMSATASTLQDRRQGALELRVLCDLERLLLTNLLRKDDAFFAGRSRGEILNRFGGDIKRVSAWRSLALQQGRSALLICGNLYFFATRDWRLAVLAALTVALSAASANRLTRSVQSMDRTYLDTDDRVKGSFEELLETAPEVQVSNLFGAVLRRFAGMQAPRTKMFVRYVRLESLVAAMPMVGYALALVALMLASLFVLTDHDVVAAAAMVPVILKALPELFTNSSSLVSQRLVIHRAKASGARLMEYESVAGEPGAPPSEAPKPAPITLRDVTFRYTGSDGTPQGGVVGVSAELPVGKWSALVGAAGSGKSTVLQLLLGRARAQAGAVSFGERAVDEMSDAERAAVLALMPQKYVALDTTIEQNLVFGRENDERATLSASDLEEVVEAVGLGDVCRAKALEMLPAHAASEKLAAQISALREAIVGRLAADVIPIAPYGKGAVDPVHWTLESVVGGRCDRRGVLATLESPKRDELLAAISREGLLGELSKLGERVLDEQRRLLDLPSYEGYLALVAIPVEEAIWRLRREATRKQQDDAPRRLATVGLTASLAELGDSSAQAMVGAWRERFAADIRALTAALAGLVGVFDSAKVNPYLTWRENVLFGVIEAGNHRTAARVDQLIVETIHAKGLGEELTRLGLGYQIGRGGARLSGGQRQLVALARAMLRRTPVLILDEPTSALDPASRSRVAKVLSEWRRDRVVVTVSHDAAFVREADHVLLLERGRLVASGAFDELRKTSDVFRRTMRVSQ